MTKIGAFEAKTHFSELLRRVEQGESFEITRRSEPVARLVGVAHDPPKETPEELLRRIRRVRGAVDAKKNEIREWIAAGRR